MYWYLMSSLVMGICGLIIYLYYLQRGQFDDPEDVKYELFRDKEE